MQKAILHYALRLRNCVEIIAFSGFEVNCISVMRKAGMDFRSSDIFFDAILCNLGVK